MKWKPNKTFQLDAYGNVLRSDGGNDDFGAYLKSANEVFMRGTFYF